MKQIRFFVPLLIALGVALSLGGQTHAYSQTRLMDDQVFDNVNSLSSSQVADFLAARSGPFTKLSTASPCLSGYNDINFHWDGSVWHYGSGTDWNTAWGPAQIPASTVIAQAAQMWGINPQVLIATLQKEESLVTGTSCDGWRYNSAMGYGCPDSGGCNPKYAGFTKQVLWGAWQLKFNKERSYGNTAWDGDDVITYVGYMTQGTRKRCGTCTANYYDGYATLDGQSVYLENGTTASLYTYTPHLGNSTPVNFEKWFGSATVPNYSANYVTQSTYPTVFPGQTAAASITYKNLGDQVWYDDSTAGAAGKPPVHLATSHPINRRSLFGSSWGANQNRPNLTFSAVINSGGVVYGTNPHAVQPGESARFDFNLTAPANASSGVYREYFQPVAEGTNDGAFADPGTYLDITVSRPTYSAQFAGQSAFGTIVGSGTFPGFFKYKNVGNVPWYDDSSAGGAGALPVHLATSSPINRSSPLGLTWGPNHNRPALTFTTVYESDGTTLASDQHMVQPGQIGKFSFTFNSPANGSGGFFREYFMPVLEGSSNGAFNDPGTYLEISVTAKSYAAQYAGQSTYPTIARGSSTAAFFKYKNVGNTPWYDDTSVTSNPGNLPVHLATSHPINRVSLFGSTWGGNQNRPALVFAAVYESDGTTLATDQHVVQPGQIGKLGFTLSASSSAITLSYREYFMPIVEGTDTGAFNDPGTYLDITVTP